MGFVRLAMVSGLATYWYPACTERPTEFAV